MEKVFFSFRKAIVCSRSYRSSRQVSSPVKLNFMRLRKDLSFKFSAKHCVLLFFNSVFCYNLYKHASAFLSSDIVIHAKTFLIKTSRGLL